MKTLLRRRSNELFALLDQRVQAFCRQLATSCRSKSLNQRGPVPVLPPLAELRRLAHRRQPQTTQFLDYQVVNSDIEAERDHLRVGDHIVRVLTMKEAIAETRPLGPRRLLKIPGNFHVVTEWTPIPGR